jgi:hypothetical protein
MGPVAIQLFLPTRSASSSRSSLPTRPTPVVIIQSGSAFPNRLEAVPPTLAVAWFNHLHPDPRSLPLPSLA